MENEIIKIDHTDKGKEFVSARELYEKLGFNITRWAKWCKKNITDNPFAIEGLDFQSLDPRSNEGPGNFAQDYLLAIPFAKRICMLARTEIGERIRNYFIEREKISYQKPALTQSDLDYDLIIKLATEGKQQRLLLENNKPKVEYYDNVLQSDSLITTTIIAKELGMTAKRLNRILRLKHIQFYQSKNWFLHARFDNKGYMSTKTYPKMINGELKTFIHTYWTEKGRQWIHNMYKNGII